MTEIVCLDKDSTLADNRHRRALATQVLAGKATWHDYSRACTDDVPIEGTRALMYLLAPHYPLHILTSSQDCPEAREWLHRHRFPYSEIRFREDNDQDTPAAVLKVRWIKELQAAGYDVKLLVEDFVDVCAAVEEHTGVPCLTINPRYSDHTPESV